MNFTIQVVGMILLSVAVCCAATNPEKEGDLPDYSKMADALAGKLTNTTEQALNAVRIPVLSFAQANLYDCITFLQSQLRRSDAKDAALKPRIVVDVEMLIYLSKASEMTCGASNISVFQVMRLIEAAYEVRFDMKDDLVIMGKKPADQPRHATGKPTLDR